MTRPNSAPRAASYLAAGLIAIIGGLVCAGGALAQTPAQTVPPATDQVMRQGGAASVSTPASVTASSDQKPAATPKERGERIVCKKEPILGTRLKSTRTCRTVDEWRRISAAYQDQLKASTDRGGRVPAGN